MARTNGTGRTKLEAFAEELVASQLEEIDAKIDELNAKLEVFDRIKVQRDKLTMARRALMGVGSRTTGNAGSRITQDEVAKALDEFEDGATVTMLMESVPGANDGQIRGHLNRGNNERFLKRGDGHWFLRDPEAGRNTVSDLV